MISQQQERYPRKMQVNNQDTDGSINNNKGEWLELSLGRTSSRRDDSMEYEQTKPTFHKIYTCNYCMRKFYSSQALGGHQNAHKRERGVPRRYHSQELMSSMMMNIPFIHTAPPTSDVSASSSTHSMVVQNPNILEGNNTIGHFADMEASSMITQSANQHSKTTHRNMVWPGNFHVDDHGHSATTDDHPLDLNLSL
ncbi:hypothetical protein MKW92_050696 [Papaver armeniacum]|nr:hypothetical protein MKW92_050696 [Papaver armeniacum]